MNDFPHEQRALLLDEEQMLLFSLVWGLKPEKILEIGTGYGGGASVIASALRRNRKGFLWSIDPDPQPEAVQAFDHLRDCAKLVKAASPQGIGGIGERFDFVFIDGDHSYEGVKADIEGVLPHLALNAYLLFHDVNYPPVTQAVEWALNKYAFPCTNGHPFLYDYSGHLTDGGQLTFGFTEDAQGNRWGGLRLLKWSGL